MHHNCWACALESSPCCPQLEKNPSSNQDPAEHPPPHKKKTNLYLIVSLNHVHWSYEQSALEQQSPNILAPGTSFVEDNFSKDWGAGDGSGGNVSDGEQWEVGGSRGSFSCSPPAVRPREGGWGSCPGGCIQNRAKEIKLLMGKGDVYFGTSKWAAFD